MGTDSRQLSQLIDNVSRTTERTLKRSEEWKSEDSAQAFLKVAKQPGYASVLERLEALNDPASLASDLVGPLPTDVEELLRTLSKGLQKRRLSNERTEKVLCRAKRPRLADPDDDSEPESALLGSAS